MIYRKVTKKDRDEPLLELKNFPYKKVATGKVREIYEYENNYLLVATDRISAFDVVFNEGLSNKGALLTQLSLFWFNKTEHLINNHLVDLHEKKVLEIGIRFPVLMNRIMLVKKLKPIRIEAIVRGYLTGSAWDKYRKNDFYSDYSLPNGMHEHSKLPNPIFTPTTKSDSGHDLPITLNEAKKIIGNKLLDKIKTISLDLYNFSSKIAAKNGLIIADTKFEFGLDEEGRVYLIDEVLTSDSSRYWLKDQHVLGKELEPLDKQIIRNYLNTLDWDKKYPPPKIPSSVLDKTLSKYESTYNLLTGS